jgi:hypothetical protein
MPPQPSGKSLPWRRIGLFDRRLKIAHIRNHNPVPLEGR